jgi:hypothetical protein
MLPPAWADAGIGRASSSTLAFPAPAPPSARPNGADAGLSPQLAESVDVTASLLAVSDLHISYRENREVVDRIRAGSEHPVRRILDGHA